MSIRFFCPTGHRLKVPDDRAGKKGRCPICHQRVYVPVSDPLPSGKRKRRPAGQRRDHDPIELDPVIEDALSLDPEPRLEPHRPLAATGSVPLPVQHPPAPKLATSYVAAPAPPAAGPVPPASSSPAASSLVTSAAPPAATYAPHTHPAGSPPADQPSYRLPAYNPPNYQPPSWYAPASPASAPAGATAPAPPALFAAPAPDAAPRVEVARPGRFSPADILDWIVTATPETAAHGYRADAGKVQTVYLLAAVLTAITLLSAGPALARFNSTGLPDWAVIVLLLAGLNLVYIFWMVMLPDWSVAWVGMILCAATTAVYSAGMALALATRAGHHGPIDLVDVQNTAAGWCGAIAILFGLACYGLGRTSTTWRREILIRRR